MNTADFVSTRETHIARQMKDKKVLLPRLIPENASATVEASYGPEQFDSDNMIFAKASNVEGDDMDETPESEEPNWLIVGGSVLAGLVVIGGAIYALRQNSGAPVKEKVSIIDTPTQNVSRSELIDGALQFA